jgi:hypothetical protein
MCPLEQKNSSVPNDLMLTNSNIPIFYCSKLLKNSMIRMLFGALRLEPVIFLLNLFFSF